MAILSLNVISVIAVRCHGEKVKGMIFMAWNGGGGGAPGAFKRQLPRLGGHGAAPRTKRAARHVRRLQRRRRAAGEVRPGQEGPDGRAEV